MIRTGRLILRRWRPSDREPFAALNADPEVMRYFNATLPREESHAWIKRIDAFIASEGFGLFAVERVQDGAFLGFTGIWPLKPTNPLHPRLEIGWRLARPAWGHGYASEAAAACLADGFGRLGLREVVSVAAEGNLRSIAVMRRIGMTRRPDLDYDHPDVPEGQPNRRHVVYRATPEDLADRPAADHQGRMRAASS